MRSFLIWAVPIALVELQHAIQVGGRVQVLEKLHVHRDVFDAELFQVLDVLDHQLGAGGEHLVAFRVQDRGRELVVLEETGILEIEDPVLDLGRHDGIEPFQDLGIVGQAHGL